MTTALDKIAWQETYNLGIDVMDTQHRRLVTLLNDVHSAISAGEGHEEVTRAVSDLMHYTQIHFLSEEQFLRRARFPHLSTHIAEHEKLLNYMQCLQKGVRDSDPMLATKSILSLMSSLGTHLAEADHEYGVFIRQNRRMLH